MPNHLHLARDASRFCTGGALSFLSVWQHLQPFHGHREGWPVGPWLSGGPLDAPAFLSAGSTSDYLSDPHVDPPILPKPLSTGHYRPGYFDED